MIARRLLVATALLSCCSGGASENRVSGKILAFAGETVILPCYISVRDDNPTVEWSKEDLDQRIVFLYRDGCETNEMKNPAFRYRTNLFMNELKNGNISLRISDVQLSDAGKYICKMVQKTPREVTRELVVGAASEPKLSVVPAVDGGVTLQCEANCWFPKPEITFLDEQGNNIGAEDPKSNLDSRGCFTVTRRVTMQTASRVTCRVHQPDINQTRVTDIDIPVISDNYMKSCIIPTSLAVGVTIMLCSLIAILSKKFCNSEGGQKSLVSRQSSDQSTTQRNADVYPPRNQADDDGNTTTKYKREIEELMSRLDDKEGVIRQLNEELNDLRSKLNPVVCQHGQPTFDNSPSKSSPDVSKPINLPTHQFALDNSAKPAASTNSNRPKPGNSPQKKDSKPGGLIQIPAPGPQIQTSSHNYSSPPLSTDNGAESPSSSSAKGHVDRSMSFSRPRQNSVRPQRRNTISVLSNNRFSILGSWDEDSEPLMQ